MQVEKISKKIHKLENLYKVYKKTNLLINSYATYRNSQSHLKERAFYCELGGGSNDVDLVSENHHKINLIAREDLLLNEGVVLFCGSLLTPPC